MPAVCAVLSSERPGFYRKTLSRAYSAPKGPRCGFTILRVDRGHPRFGIRPDEIGSLTGVLKPYLIHEVRYPIRRERPGGYRKTLQQPSLELQIGIEGRVLDRNRSLRSQQLQDGNPVRREDVRSEIVLQIEHADELRLLDDG